MASDELKQLASRNLQELVSAGAMQTPISAFELLAKFISSPVVPSSRGPSFRLTDLCKLEGILEEFAESWDAGVISVLRDDNGLSLMQVNLDAKLLDASNPKKRKRLVDEDADSAEEEEASSSALSSKPKSAATSSLSNLSKNMQEIYALLQRGTARRRLLAEQHQSVGVAFEPICPNITKDECAKAGLASQKTPRSSSIPSICPRVHFRPLMRPHTDPTLGHCSYLNTCYSEPTYAQSPSIPPFPSANLPRPPGSVTLPNGLGAGGRGKEKAPCRYLHFEIDWDGGDGEPAPTNTITKKKPHKLGIGLGPSGEEEPLLPPQWLNCDLRRFDYSVLGKFHVIMADPPWDIHMSLPYGTMTDDEMKAMPIPALQDEGLLFLWVTGRAMEIGRECMRVWGYSRVDEVVWVKTNQLQRVIRTGRTGHWLNHTKEHMLVGVKSHWDGNGNLKFPAWCNRGIDTDVIVSEVRETSRKPDEVYGLIERMCPGGRKVEIFGRKHNSRPGWLTLGNQLGGDQIYDEDLKTRIKSRMINSNLSLPPNPSLPQVPRF
ncbi:MT-A70-domain-containing protein [Phellopilus nigrolimitatus]|nr:MT-A70-domain-containing protein [Phellopilus nigrolimitatus]